MRGVQYAFLTVMFSVLGCAQVEQDSVRALENANEVVSSAGAKAWTGTPAENQDKDKDKAAASGETTGR